MKFKILYFVFALVFAFSSVASARHHHRRHHRTKTSHVTVHHFHDYPRYMPMMVEPMPMIMQPAPVYFVNEYAWRPNAYVVREYMQPVCPHQGVNVFLPFW